MNPDVLYLRWPWGLSDQYSGSGVVPEGVVVSPHLTGRCDHDSALELTIVAFTVAIALYPVALEQSWTRAYLVVDAYLAVCCYGRVVYLERSTL